MRRQVFKRFFFLSTIIALLPLAFSSIVFGQNAGTNGCGETDYDCLIARYEKESTPNPKLAETYFQRATRFSTNNQYDLAIKDLDMAIYLNPKFEDAFYNRGYVYIQLNLYAEAIKNFNRVKELNPANSNAGVSLTYIYEQIKKGGLPIEEYDKLIQLEPTKAEFYYGRARLYFYKLKKFDYAIEDATKAIELNPKYFEAYAIRSDSYCSIGKKNESNADITRYENLTGKKTKAVCKACDREPIDCQINDVTEQIVLGIKKGLSTELDSLYYERGGLYYKKKDYSSALSDYNKSKDRYKKSLEYMGDIYLLKGENDAALDSYIQYLKTDFPSTQVNLNVGNIYLIEREYEKAFEYFDRVIVLRPGNIEALFARGSIYLERAENFGITDSDEFKIKETYKKAIEDFDFVIKTNPANINLKVYLKRAEAYEKLGEQANADADRAKYIELSEKP